MLTIDCCRFTDVIAFFRQMIMKVVQKTKGNKVIGRATVLTVKVSKLSHNCLSKMQENTLKMSNDSQVFKIDR